MGKDISFKNHDRFIHLGIAIAALRKMRGMSQEQLAEKAGISRSLISAIEAPGLAKSFSLDVFFNLADALDIASCRSDRRFGFSGSGFQAKIKRLTVRHISSGVYIIICIKIAGLENRLQSGLCRIASHRETYFSLKSNLVLPRR